MKLTNKEAIANLNHIYGIVSPDIQRSLDVAFKALEEKPQGEWIDYDNTFYKCPDCGYLLEKCCPQCQNKVILPNCGAKMKKGES